MRKITKVIIHCTATPEGRYVTVDDVDIWHRARGFNKIGYHYLIGLDGAICNGRAESEVGAHCLGQNENSIGVCYVGGVAKDGKTPKDTRTDAQKDAIAKLVKTLKIKYPEATIHGHCEFAAKACPSFDVKTWVKELGLI